MRSVSIDEFRCDKLKYGFVMGDQIMKASVNGTLNILTLYIQKQVFRILPLLVNSRVLKGTLISVNMILTLIKVTQAKHTLLLDFDGHNLSSGSSWYRLSKTGGK